MRATVAWLAASCLLVSAAAFYRHAKVQGPLVPAPPEGTERVYGRWRCAEPPHADKVVRLEVAGQPLIVCAAETAAAGWVPGQSFLLAAADGGRYHCRYCRSSRWVPPAPSSRIHPLPEPETQCRLRPQTRSLHRQDPSGGLLPFRRLDGVACHRAFTMGCHNGYRWCHGSCCRHDSFFFYPDLQPRKKINRPYRSQTNKNANFAVRRVVADGPVDWTKIVDGKIVVIE